MAVTGSTIVGVDRSIAPEYALESVLNVVGSLGSSEPKARDALLLTPTTGLICRDSLGLFGGLLTWADILFNLRKLLLSSDASLYPYVQQNRGPKAVA